MDTARMREVIKRRKEADANNADGEGTLVPRPPPTPPKRVQPITTVPAPKAPGKRPRTESEQGSADLHRSSSPSSRIISGTDGFRIEDSRSLCVAMNSAMSLLRSAKNFSDVLAKKAKKFLDPEGEAEEALETARADMKAAVATRELLGQELNRVSKEHTQYVSDMALRNEELEYQQVSAYIRGYETAMENVKFKTPNYDFTDLCWDTKLKDGRLVTGGEFSALHLLDDVVGGEAPGDQEVQQEMPQQDVQQGIKQP